jgi:hypothetical protein
MAAQDQLLEDPAGRVGYVAGPDDSFFVTINRQAL